MSCGEEPVFPDKEWRSPEEGGERNYSTGLSACKQRQKIAFTKDIKQKALKIGQAISKFIHHNSIPPNVAIAPYYKAMVDTIVEVGLGVMQLTANKMQSISLYGDIWL